MSDSSHIQINRRFALPRSELQFRATRSGGPGGQHVNTSATRIELTWDVGASRALSERRRQILQRRLAGRIDQQGVLRIVVDSHRSQHRNREEAVERLTGLLAEALRPRKKRRPTRPPARVKERRLKEKKRRGEVKRLRGRVTEE